MARKRRLSPEEKELWARVAKTAAPLDPMRKPAAPVPGATAFPRLPLPQPPDPPALTPFQLGDAQPKKPRIATGTAPSPAQNMAAHGLRMDPKTHRRMMQGKLRPEARLDLHGMTLAEAHPELMAFLASCHTRGLRLVLVITGKGRGDHGPLPTRPGALRHQVPVWLHQPPLSLIVQQVRAAHFRHGGEGAYYVYLRR